MQNVFQFFLGAHILSGSIALFCGTLIMAMAKGGQLHKNMGKWFFFAMLGVFITSVVLSLLRQNWFLLCIGFFSFYMAAAGYRVLAFKQVQRYAAGPALWDQLLGWGGMLAGLALLGLAIYFWLGGSSFGLVPLVFGILSFTMALTDYRKFFKQSTGKGNWVVTHASRMGGAYIATVTAFIVVNFEMEPAWVLWLLPSAILSPLLSIQIRRFMQPKVSKVPSVSILVLIVSSLPALAQPAAPENYPTAITTIGKSITKQQAIEDINILYTALVNYHPNPYAYIADSTLKAYFLQQTTNLPDTIDELGFHFQCRQLIAQIKCGHTFAKPSDAWYASLKGKNVLLPFDVRIVNQRLFVSNTIDEKFEFKVGDEVLSINNVAAKDILEKMSVMQERDGNTQSFIYALIEKRFRTYLLFTMGIQDDYIIVYKSGKDPARKVTVAPTLKKLQEVKIAEPPANFIKITGNSWSALHLDTTLNTAYLKISSFSDRKEFKKYYKSVFILMKKEKSTNLILDIRDNPGGYFGNGNNLLTYLTPAKFDLTFQKPKRKQENNPYIGLKKWSKWTKLAFSLKPSRHRIKGQSTTTFTYKPSKYLFQGNVHVLINGITFSQAALVAAQLKENGAEFYGQETGGTEIGCNGILNYDLVLPNSELAVTIPVYSVKSNSSAGKSGYGVQPDYVIAGSIDNSKDYILEAVLSSVKNKK